MTVGLTASIFFGGNHEKSRKFFGDHRYMHYMLSKSQFNRRLHAIDSSIWEQLQYILAQVFKETNDSNEYIVDSFPVAVCQNIRISRCKIYQSEDHRGFSASKRQYFFGIRVHMITTIGGGPVEFVFAPGCHSDAKVFKYFDFYLPRGSSLYGDAMYNDYEYEDDLKEDLNINLLVARKSNMKRQHEPWIKFWINHCRKKIETTFSQITNLFPKKIHCCDC